MKKYGDSGDIIHSLDTANGEFTLYDIIGYDSSMFGQDGFVKDMFEVLVKGAAFNLAEQGKINNKYRDIFLYCMGIDEYYPKLNSATIASIFKIEKDKVRHIRYYVAKKVLKEIRDDK